MEPIVTLATDADSIEFTGTDIAGAYIYDNDFLDSWLSLSEVNAKFNKRPNAHGTYAPDQLFTGEKRIKFPGRYLGASALDATYARNRLAGLFNDGLPLTITVEDDLGPTSRTVYMVAYDPEWMPDGSFVFEAEFAAPDPRRYGLPITPASVSLPSASSGLIWPLGTGSSFWDWGTAGTTGRVTVTNDGNTTTYPIIEVGAGGSLASGFELTEVETGRALTYVLNTAGQVVRIDNRTQRATVNGGDVTNGLTRKEWFSVPPRASRTYQYVSLGSVTGTPVMNLRIASAYL